jgi:hypothetical protein
MLAMRVHVPDDALAEAVPQQIVSVPIEIRAATEKRN